MIIERYRQIELFVNAALNIFEPVLRVAQEQLAVVASLPSSASSNERPRTAQMHHQ